MKTFLRTKLLRAGFAAALIAIVPAALDAQAGQSTALTYELARQAIDAAEAEARANGWNVTIVVTDADAVPIYLRRLDGASPRSYDIAMRKARTSAATGLSSIDYGRQVADGAREAIPEGAPIAGGLPIRLGGELVGTIATSGVRADQDEQISRAGLQAVGGG